MLTVKHNARLRPYNTMRVDGSVNAVVGWGDFVDLFRFFTEEEYAPLRQRVIPVGHGSNLLFVDNITDATLLVHDYTDDIQFTPISDGASVGIPAGMPLDAACEKTCKLGYWGMEALSLIPGTAGGAVVQNAGAYGVEMSDIVTKVMAYDIENESYVSLDPDDLQYSYRHSMFKTPVGRGRFIVTRVYVRLSDKMVHEPRCGIQAGDTPEDVRRRIIEIRRAKLPSVDETGSAGSFFKNPEVTDEELTVLKAKLLAKGIDPRDMPSYPGTGGHTKLSAAWLIDRSGLKGVSMGNVGTWPIQPLVIVNLTGDATGAEVENFARYVVDKVRETFDIILTPEVEYIK